MGKIAGLLWHGGNPLSTGELEAPVSERASVTKLSSSHAASEDFTLPAKTSRGLRARGDRLEHDLDAEDAEEEQPKVADRAEDAEDDAKKGYVIRMRLPYKHMKRLALEGKADSFTVSMAPGS